LLDEFVYIFCGPHPEITSKVDTASFL
jgi:hypothetical protein